ncbi:peptidase inhibitor family I36 protein [Streptomyces sp. JJ66]|nr:peptidase inhibitor family I36 protein [Streptomyces sp. JJ66]
MGRALAVAAATLALATTPALAAPPAEPEAAPRLGACGPGQLCLWQGGGFSGERHVYELTDTGIESCVALPDGVSAGALANRTGRPVTAYQSRVCAEEGEFHTHPSGSWSPRTPYAVRAVKVWER